MPIWSANMPRGSAYQQHEEGRGLTASALSCPYSPYCVELEFSEVAPSMNRSLQWREHFGGERRERG